MSTTPPGRWIPQAPLRRELPWLLAMAALLTVLLHANAPEVWFWFGILLLLWLWRWVAWLVRRQDQLQGSSNGSSTGSEG